MCARVATTQWSQVLAARDGSDTEARKALEALCQTYWQPLYAYVRHQGSSPEEASDLTQGYFAELLEKDLIAEVDPAKGRFRSFLLASLRNSLAHERRRARALKRGGGKRIVSLDTDVGEKGYLAQSNETQTPGDVFQQRWATTVLERAMTEASPEFDVWPFHFVNRYGYLEDHSRHRVKLNGFVILPLDFSLAINGWWNSEFRWTPQTRQPPVPYGTMYLEPRGNRSESGRLQLDLQVGKGFNWGRTRLKLFATVYNALDSEKGIDVCNKDTGCGNFEMGDPIEWQQPRRYELGVRVEF